MARKIRKDITVGALEKKLGVTPGTIKNPNGSDARSDKKLETLQKEAAKAAKKPVSKKVEKKTDSGKRAAKPVTADQKTASLRKVKNNPKAKSSMVKKVRAAVKKTVK
ncbi:hypothetical protein [Olivibacter sp. XZL3]|uniref:hypothetical protein n=1 Tax=Olivibacter sp. XZL3 TaxID=1735116 RepID=UPI00106569F5|nr:hypothetical protein [Olivibacter sp. XZL3]